MTIFYCHVRKMYEVENRVPNFDKYPVKAVPGVVATKGIDAIVEELNKKIGSLNKEKVVVCIDYYHGINENLVKEIANKLSPSLIVDGDDCKYDESIISKKFAQYITEDRVNGVYIVGTIADFLDPECIEATKKQIEEAKGLVVVHGVAASLVCNPDVLVYGNISSQTIKDKWKEGLDNWGAKNYDEDYLRKEKRWLFVECIVQDKHKRKMMKECDYIVDFNRDDDVVMLTQSQFDTVVMKFATSPFKPIPIFLAGVWGGNWAQKVLGVAEGLENSAWGVHGYLDWQAVAAQLDNALFEFPSTDLVQYAPKETLGRKIWYLYGYRCPLHVNFLDTWGGQNLSLQVHPTISYAQEEFNSKWGHYESYYMLDACENSSVYLGTKDGVKLDELVEAFEEAQVTGEFDDEKWINNFPMKKHDHIFIPGGTIHSSAKDTLTLEIDLFSFTTFKLWDWGRLDYDGKPRPINIDHGKNVIQEEFQTTMIKDQFISKKQEIACGHGWRKERSGTNTFESPMEVNRYWFKNAVHFDPNDCIMIHVLVEGEEAILESLDGEFEPMIMHYAEAVFVPPAAGQYTIRPYGKSAGEELAVLEVYVNC
ncbi:class I mannose-6-phosphate isomerase [Tannockella kyphosi]|uniref:class I mannose-6-phosphate isomerase n=1 Tax=Tannockella kyphosi TaxID=2899121 RepID=UPI002012C9F7|nr:class I mannose-6-phosphate isomerase [Tannockella kyphosi]